MFANEIAAPGKFIVKTFTDAACAPSQVCRTRERMPGLKYRFEPLPLEKTWQTAG